MVRCVVPQTGVASGEGGLELVICDLEELLRAIKDASPSGLDRRPEGAPRAAERIAAAAVARMS